MKIHRMTAVFGRLQNETLELKDGLNILEAPNETGKSTWCGFLLSMLYGINSRERERAGFIPDKTRYAPWSGSPMSGRLECRVNGQDLTITRSTRRQTSPMGEFQAVYTGTGDSVPDLTGQTCGETLTGVSKEVFERSAFIRQAGLSISQDAELERRIASLITAGEEGTSYSEASDLLKKQLNRRRHHKTGQIPLLEHELQELEHQQEEAARLTGELTSAIQRTESLSAQEIIWNQELAQHNLWEAAQQSQALAEAAAEYEQAERTAEDLRQRLLRDRIPENETIGRLRGALVNLSTTRKNLEKARGERDEAAKTLLRAEAAVNDTAFTGLTPTQAEKLPLDIAAKPRFPLWAAVLLPLLGAGLGSLLYWQTNHLPLAIGAGLGLSGVGILVMGLLTGRTCKVWETTLAELRQRRAEELASYTALYETLEAARTEAEQKSAHVDTLYNIVSSNEQGILLEIRRFAPAAVDTSIADKLLWECAVRRKVVQEAEAAAQKARMRYEVLQQHAPQAEISGEIPPPERSREEVAVQLSQVQAALSAARSAADRLTGQLNAMGDPVVLSSSAEHLKEQLGELEGEYDAIHMAMDALDAANTTLQNRFSPELGRRAAEIFSELTNGKYSGVVLDRNFHLSAEPAGDVLYRDAALLSAGTADQLYLATRLAICDLVLPEENQAPIILDDALANFDDARCASALRWLKQEAKHRQILLFTCHSREGKFFTHDNEVSIQHLTGLTESV